MFYRDLMDGDDHPDPERAHGFIDSVLDGHYHRGHRDRYSEQLDEYLKYLADQELESAPGLVREAMHAAMDRYMEQAPARLAQIEELDSVDEVFDIGPEGSTFCEMPLLPSEASDRSYTPSRPVAPSSPPATPPFDPVESTSNAALLPPSSLCLDTSSVVMDAADDNRFARVRESLDAKDCRCGGLRKIFRRFANAEQAQLAHSILLGDHHHLLDPAVVHDGDVFCTSDSMILTLDGLYGPAWQLA